MKVQSVTTTTITLTLDDVKDLLREHHAERLGVPVDRVQVSLSGTDSDCLTFSLLGESLGQSPTTPGSAIAGSATKRRRKRRTAADIADLTERLYRAVCAKPGESMGVLALDAGATPRQLEYPMDILKASGRVSFTGSMCNTRYFPAKEAMQ